MQIPLAFRDDLLVADTVILEVEAIPGLVPAYEAQLPTYLRKPLGADLWGCMNFYVKRRKDGLKRVVALLPPRHFAALPLSSRWKWRKNERARW
jgi:hypothetical protein